MDNKLKDIIKKRIVAALPGIALNIPNSNYITASYVKFRLDVCPLEISMYNTDTDGCDKTYLINRNILYKIVASDKGYKHNIYFDAE